MNTSTLCSFPAFFLIPGKLQDRKRPERGSKKVSQKREDENAFFLRVGISGMFLVFFGMKQRSSQDEMCYYFTCTLAK